MDSNEFVLARDAPYDDMFREWNLGQRPVEGNIVDEPAWWEKYNLPLLPTAGMPRGTGGTPAVPLVGHRRIRRRRDMARKIPGQRLDAPVGATLVVARKAVTCAPNDTIRDGTSPSPTPGGPGSARIRGLDRERRLFRPRARFSRPSIPSARFRFPHSTRISMDPCDVAGSRPDRRPRAVPRTE